MSDTAKFIIKGETFEFPIVVGTEGEHAIDISTLRGRTNYVTIDNGFVNTGSCQSAITFLNGEKGILRYRGYPIEQLADHSSFREVSFLLNYGELPNERELIDFNRKVAHFERLPEGVKKIIDAFPTTAHPMGVISSATASLASFYPEYLNLLTSEQKDDAIPHLMSQMKMMIAYYYRRTQNLTEVDSNPDFSYAGDFLNMMFGGGEYKVDAKVADALDDLLILHADHEQNCSASTVRVVGSSQANVFASISGGINALWGQLHGGANQAVLEMLEEIEKDGGDYNKFIAKAKDKNDPFRLMGFGHRVYKNFDPRANIIRGACDTVLKSLGVTDPLLDIARGLEKVALKDEYFISRNLYPNVDFYSGIIYRALGIPTSFFTAMFVLGRLPGWLAQWKEMTETPGVKISRPRQIYTGETERNYLALNKR